MIQIAQQIEAARNASPLGSSGRPENVLLPVLAKLAPSGDSFAAAPHIGAGRQ